MPDLQASKFHIRTSGCRTFRRCLRKWGFISSMRQNLTGKGAETNINFWFGTGIHFALEDFFGYNRFGDPRAALEAYYGAFNEDDRPEAAEGHFDLGMSMLTYLLEWYPKHNQAYGFETIWLNEKNEEVEPHTPGARPLCEESFTLDLGVPVYVREDTEDIVLGGKSEEEMDAWLEDNACHSANDNQWYIYVTDDNPDVAWGSRRRVNLIRETLKYHGTIDRIVKDKKGRWWLWDWKTAKGADTNKLDTDDQISRYMWAAEQWFQRPIHGFIYFQMTKDKVKQPKRLKSGDLSVDKKQKTTSNILRKELIKDYGSVQAAPKKLMDFLNHLISQEDVNGDRFIRWDLVQRNKAQKESTYRHIMAEVKEMADPNKYLYPTPTRDCIWDCPFRDACILMDAGKEEEAKTFLDAGFEPRPRAEDGEQDEWLKDIKWPDKPVELDVDMKYSLTPGEEADAVLNLIMPDEYK